MSLPTLQALLELVIVITMGSTSSVVLMPLTIECLCTSDTQERFIMTLPILHEMLNLVTMITLGSASRMSLIPPAGV